MIRYRIRHETLHKDPYETILTEQEFAKWAVKMEGGGYTQVQTARAMALQATANRGEAHIRGFHVTRLNDSEPEATISSMNPNQSSD